MQELMQAIAQTLRNCGFSDAVAGNDYVQVRGCAFYAHYRRSGFTFCGRHYRTGNTIQATVDLIRELPNYLARREAELREQSNYNAAEALTKKLDDRDMKVSYYNGKFTFTYSCTDLSNVASVAERIAKEMQEASDAAWQEILNSPRPQYAKFTAEGGFSLN